MAYHEPSPLEGIIITNDFAALVKLTLVSSNAANTFFGIYLFVVANGKINFAFNTVGNTMTLVAGNFMTRCRLNTITFAFGQCCAPTPYVDTTQSVCID